MLRLGLLLLALLCAVPARAQTTVSWSGQDTSQGVHSQLIFEPQSFSGGYTQSFCDGLVTSTWAARYGFVWSGRCLPGQVTTPGQVTAQNPGIVNGTYFVSYSFPTASTRSPGCTMTTSGVTATCNGHAMQAGDWVYVGTLNEIRLIYQIVNANTFTLDQAFSTNPNTSNITHVFHAELRAHPEWVLYKPDQKQPVDLFNNFTFISDPGLAAVRTAKVAQISGASVAALDNAFFSPPGLGCTASICGPKGRWSTGFATTGSFSNLYGGATCNDDCDLAFTDAVIGFFQHLKDNAAKTLIVPNGDIRFITEKNSTCSQLADPTECYDSARVAALKSAVHAMFIEGSELVNLYADRDSRKTWLRNLRLLEDLQAAPNGVAVLSNAYYFENCPASGSVECIFDTSKHTSHTITAVSVAGNYVEISGDQRAKIGIGHRVSLSGANSGTYIVDVPPVLQSSNTRVTFASVTQLTSSTVSGSLTTALYGPTTQSNQPPAMIQWILASYLLSNNGKSYLSLPHRGYSNANGQHNTASVGTYNFYSQWWPEFTAVGTGTGAALGAACAARARSGGGTAEVGVWFREYTGGYVVANADRTNAASSHALPAGAWTWQDLYGASVSSPVSVVQLGARILLKQGATGCSSGGGGTQVLTVQSSPSGAAMTGVTTDVNSNANGTTTFTRTYNTGSDVTVTAPASFTASTVTYNFVSWSGADSASGTGNRTANVHIDSARTITASYSAATPATVSVAPAVSYPTGALLVTWSGIGNPQARDWFAIAATGSISTQYIHWLYVSCSQTSGSAVASGTCQTTLPATAATGNYIVRLFTNDSFGLLAESGVFAIDTAARRSAHAGNVVMSSGVTMGSAQ